MIPNPGFSELGTSRALHFPLGNMNQSTAGFSLVRWPVRHMGLAPQRLT